MATSDTTSLRPRILLGLLLAAVAASLVAVAAFLPAILYPAPDASSIDTAQMSGKDKLDLLNSALQQQNAFRSTLVQSIIGLGALSGAMLAWRQYGHMKADAVRREHEKREDFHLDLFGAALENLGADAPGLRAGGIYALARLAEMSSSHRQACADVLSTFVRTRSPWPPSPSRPEESRVMLAETGRSLRDYDPDVQTALTLLGQHTYKWHQVRLRLRHLDLRKANLSGGHYEGAAFTETRLDGAWLRDADFNGASFRGTSLVNADLRGANLDRCNVRDTDFTGANLDGTTMRGATFDSRTRWPQGLSAQTALAAGAVEVPRTAPATSAIPEGVIDE